MLGLRRLLAGLCDHVRGEAPRLWMAMRREKSTKQGAQLRRMLSSMLRKDPCGMLPGRHGAKARCPLPPPLPLLLLGGLFTCVCLVAGSWRASAVRTFGATTGR